MPWRNLETIASPQSAEIRRRKSPSWLLGSTQRDPVWVDQDEYLPAIELVLGCQPADSYESSIDGANTDSRRGSADAHEDPERTGAAPPTLSLATNASSTTLTGWTTTISAGDCLRFNVDSITTCTRMVLCLKVTKT